MDTEVLALTADAKKLQVMIFSPGKTGLARLDAEAAKYSRYYINRVTITYSATASISDQTVVTYGLCPGAQASSIKGDGDITKLRPFNKHAAWNSSSSTVSRNIQATPYLYTNGVDEDHVAFCLYITTGNEKLGCVKITYDVMMSYPIP